VSDKPKMFVVRKYVMATSGGDRLAEAIGFRKDAELT
jgi:hypothetical protein